MMIKCFFLYFTDGDLVRLSLIASYFQKISNCLLIIVAANKNKCLCGVK